MEIRVSDMGNERTWNEESRENLRATLRWVILGELRLARRDNEGILDTCREVYIQEECPKREWNAFIDFAMAELHRVASRLTFEMATWPQETDCDRLDRVEVSLHERGICLWQVSPCCDTCTVGELWDRIYQIDQHFPGFSNRV